MQLVWVGSLHKLHCLPRGHYYTMRSLLLNSLREVSVSVTNVHTIKPLDAKAIVAAAQSAGAVVTIEEHQVAGGLGSAVAEVLAATYPVPMEFVGVHDQFGQSGEMVELIEHYKMGVQHIVDAVRAVQKRKNI